MKIEKQTAPIRFCVALSCCSKWKTNFSLRTVSLAFRKHAFFRPEKKIIKIYRGGSAAAGDSNEFMKCLTWLRRATQESNSENASACDKLISRCHKFPDKCFIADLSHRALLICLLSTQYFNLLHFLSMSELTAAEWLWCGLWREGILLKAKRSRFYANRASDLAGEMIEIFWTR